MINYIYILSIIIFIYLTNNYFIKKKMLQNATGELHQSFTSNKKIPLSGGIYLIISFLLLFSQITLINKIIILIFYLIGFFSDIKILKSPYLRLIFQILLIFIFIFINEILLENTRVIFIDILLDNKLWNYIFVIFCITIVVNGTNFLDGVNCNVIGYYLIISLILYKLNIYDSSFIEQNSFFGWIIVVFSIYLLNFSNKLYLGDNGSYFLGFIYSYLLISYYLNNQSISPFFIILLLWYPSFENLFSLIRKLNIGRSPFKPDQNHLHQLIFNYLKNKKIISKNFINSLSGNILILYNLVIFYFASLKPENTQYQILFIILNIIIYCFVYLRLFKFKYKSLFRKK